MFNASCIIIVNRNRKLDPINNETIINYQIGRLKRMFKQVNVVYDTKNMPKYLDAPVYFSKYRKFKNLGKIVSGFPKIRTNANIFVSHEIIDLNKKEIEQLIENLKDYMFAFPVVNNKISFVYGAVNKKYIPELRSFLFSKDISCEQDVLKKFKVNYFSL
ncbi:hypothetical protein ACFL4A_00010 [bacterium]